MAELAAAFAKPKRAPPYPARNSSLSAMESPRKFPVPTGRKEWPESASNARPARPLEMRCPWVNEAVDSPVANLCLDGARRVCRSRHALACWAAWRARREQRVGGGAVLRCASNRRLTGRRLGGGLLAWEDPRRTDGPASPFWARAPMLEGEWGREAPPPARLVENAGARLSALRLADGTLILKIENGSEAAQMRIRPGPDAEMGTGPVRRLGQSLALARLHDAWRPAGVPGPHPQRGPRERRPCAGNPIKYSVRPVPPGRFRCGTHICGRSTARSALPWRGGSLRLGVNGVRSLSIHSQPKENQQ